MNRCRALTVYCVLLALVLPSCAWAQGAAPALCSDSVYVELKKKPVDSLSVREYEIFRERDRACVQQLAAQVGQGGAASPVSPDPGTAAQLGWVEGRRLAESRSTSGWFAGGVASGMVLSFLGTGIVTLAASTSGTSGMPPDDVILANRPSQYTDAFQSSYRERLTAKRTRSALKGGLLGNAVILMAVMYAWRSPD